MEEPISFQREKEGEGKGGGEVQRKTVCVLVCDPIALRKTKIAYNFGLSECNSIRERGEAEKEREE